jgi:hypothetical protein
MTVPITTPVVKIEAIDSRVPEPANIPERKIVDEPVTERGVAVVEEVLSTKQQERIPSTQQGKSWYRELSVSC